MVCERKPHSPKVPHPMFGKMLVCKRKLPAGYRVALFGEVQKDDDIPEVDAVRSRFLVPWVYFLTDGEHSHHCSPVSAGPDHVLLC